MHLSPLPDMLARKTRLAAAVEGLTPSEWLRRLIARELMTQAEANPWLATAFKVIER